MRISVAAVACMCMLAVTPFAKASEGAEPEVDEKDVAVLTDSNFNETIAKHKFAIVEFYAPWCGHCKALKPAFAEAATKMKEIDASVVVAKVDATEARDLATRFAIQGFPTLKWFVDGEMVADYSGPRTAEAMVSWMKKKTGPPTTAVDNAEALEKAKDAAVSMFGYFEKPEGDAFAAFTALASKVEDATFYNLADAELAKSLGITKAPGFAVGRNNPGFGVEIVVGEGHAALAGDGELSDRLAALLAAEKLPAFIEFHPSTGQRIFGSGIDHQVIVVAPPAAFEEGAPLRAALIAASAATRGKVVWVTSKVDASEAEPILNYFALDKTSHEPQVVGFQSGAGKKYTFPEGEKVDAASLETFALAVVAGDAPRATKSAPVPAEPTDEGVTVVVGSTFDAIVKDPTKDVLLEVYAPWCGHCKALAPTYSKLAKRFKKVDSVVIAKMDGTENEVPGVEVQGFPTIMLFPAGEDSQPIDFDGAARGLKDLTMFVKKHAKIEFELAKKGDKAAEEEIESEDKEDAAAAAAEEEAEEEEEEEGEEGGDNEMQIEVDEDGNVVSMGEEEGEEGHDEL